MHKLPDLLQSYFPENYNGVLVEVGAGSPLSASHSFFFRPSDVQKKIWHSVFAHDMRAKSKTGNWKIISIEPNPQFCQEFRKHKLPILQYACSNKDIGRTTFKISPAPMCGSAMEVRISGYDEAEYKTINVRAFTLNTILKKEHPGINWVDILIIDTEGWGMEVLEGFSLSKYKPKLILVEVIGSPQSPDDYVAWMAANGYAYESDQSPNMLFVKKELNENRSAGIVPEPELHGV